jgi:hypothetical protein
MPCHPARARQLKKKGAKARWFRGLYAIQLTHRLDGDRQPIVCGIDPGMKREGFTVQSKSHTYLNIQSDSITSVSYRMLIRKWLRQGRRHRHTPCRQPRSHRRPKKKWLAPTIRSKWALKLGIINYLRKLFPITDFVIEDVAARKFVHFREWNKNFSTLELGKTEYYEKISQLGTLKLLKGYDTAARREELCLKKKHNKLSESFYSHNVDSWVLASFVTGRTEVDNENVFRIIPLRFYRRRLHFTCFQKGGVRNKYGGTICGLFKKGSFVKHSRYGLLYVSGGTAKGTALSNPSTGVVERQNGAPEEYEFLYYSPWRTNWVNDVVIVPKTEFEGGHSLRDPKVREKACQTKLEKYGNRNFTNREQAVRTCMKKYGVDNVAKLTSVTEKKKATLMARYGKIFNWDRPPTFTKEYLIDLHLNQKKTLKEIGQISNVPWQVISYWMKRHDITVQRYSVKRYVPVALNLNVKSSGDYTGDDFKRAQKLLFELNSERGVAREAYKDGALGVPTHVLEKHYGTWNNFVIYSGLKPGYVALKPADHTHDYLETCKAQNKVLSFYDYEKVTGKPATRLKRIFGGGKPYNHLRVELLDIALKPDQWESFLLKLN